MSPTSNKLRLGPLPRSESIKVTISLTGELKQALDDYAAAHSQVNGGTVDAATLIPHILGAFIARDRGFRAFQSAKSKKCSGSVTDLVA